MLKLYVANVADINFDDAVLNSLPEARIEKINRLRQIKDKKLSYGAGILINKYVLMGNKASYGYNADGKPFSTTGPCFSISHSGDYIALAVSDSNVGCDIQIANERDFLKLAKFVFHQNEINLLRKSSQMQDCFFDLWTKKEAFLKNIGTGFKRNATDIDLSQENYTENGTTYFFHKKQFDNYYISVCTENHNDELQYSIENL